ncbi:glucosidase 2 subunit beta [Amborella trichopoda]|uniref:Glucosidase II beta subunit N-terminal domain-containing protein n=1 Tax=Amborella trichopoda TaxID=13333 RepID=W1Q0F4_AMBTC|nr:glucosidase 2 subunit beta [Amborella trichopoda]ERN14004.1 hypothetical protein AMTR_s00021p00184700 [Amborella trichopoda]|eukprot:XP_020527961.1 glucosidase 2 subunit beta [Amborella trichopoda]
MIMCRDKSKFFSRDRINDGFCDCTDGTDEPGTSACPEGKFYCRNVGGTPLLLFSSRVNDHICDCCDGSDEYDGKIICMNTCFKDDDVTRNTRKIISEAETHSFSKLNDKNTHLEELIQKFRGLKTVVLLEGFLVAVMAFLFFCRYARSRRRRRH